MSPSQAPCHKSTTIFPIRIIGLFDYFVPDLKGDISFFYCICRISFKECALSKNFCNILIVDLWVAESRILSRAGL